MSEEICEVIKQSFILILMNDEGHTQGLRKGRLKKGDFYHFLFFGYLTIFKHILKKIIPIEKLKALSSEESKINGNALIVFKEVFNTPLQQ